jgi:hypothetical protein
VRDIDLASTRLMVALYRLGLVRPDRLPVMVHLAMLTEIIRQSTWTVP